MTTLVLILRRMGGMIVRPRQTGAAIACTEGLRPAALLVIAFGLWYGLMFFGSHLAADYPPPPEVLRVWVEHFGSFAMLPILNIPAESYRLFLAIIALPLALAIWMLMAGSARLLALLLRGRASYETFLSITAFGYFTFWLLSALLDIGYNALLGPYILPALNGDYGPGWHAFYQNFPALEYMLLYGWAGVSIGLASFAAEHALEPARIHAPRTLSILRAALTGFVAFAWPTLLIAVLAR